MNTSSAELSRALGVAASLSAATIDEAEIRRRPVLLTAEAGALRTANGRWCLFDCVRLLSRIVGPLTVVIPPTDSSFESELDMLVASLSPLGTVTVCTESPGLELESFKAILNVGSETRGELPWTSVNSNGWTARVTSSNEPLPTDTDQANPIAALMAASLGVAEVFKRVYELRPQTAPLFPKTQFSLLTFQANSFDGERALPLTTHLPDCVLVGAGAIGNGIALLLSQLKWRGNLHVVDYQEYGNENKGTCVLLDNQEWLGDSKAKCLADWLGENSSLKVTYQKAKVEDARSSEYVQNLAVDLVLTALDDVEARHDAQLFWPSLLVDGGINPAGCAVVTHRLDQPKAACLRCMFELPRRDLTDAQRLATGLTAESLQDQEKLLNDADIEAATESMRPWLREMQAQGKTRCSVVGEAMAKRLGANFDRDFRPSVPFVATAAAALVMAQTVKSLVYPDLEFTHHFQIESLFRGPDCSVTTIRRASPNCICTVHRQAIERLQLDRQRKQLAQGA